MTTRSPIPRARFFRVSASKMSDLHCCRFCLETIPSKHAINLFSKNSNSVNLSGRMSDLIKLPVLPTDGLSPYTCRLCRDRLLTIERKLVEAREMIKSMYQRAHLQAQTGRATMCTLKRPKETSGTVGVSPATAKNRPPSKRSALRRTLFPQGMTNLK